MPQAGIFSPELELTRGALSGAVAGAAGSGLKHAAIAGETVFACSPAMPHDEHGRRCIPCLCRQGCSPAWPYASKGLLVELDGNILNLKEMVESLYPGSAAGKKPGELLVMLYRAEGEFPIGKLFGDFTLSVYDTVEKKLFLYRSGSGSRPLYYGFAGDFLVWASDIALLRDLFGFKLELAPGAVDLYLTLNYIPAPNTAYKGLSKLRMGEMLVSCADKPASARLFTVPPAPRAFTLAAAKKEVRKGLGAAAAHAAASVPHCAFLLSGGLDSSAIVAAASESVPGRLNTISLTFPGQAESEENFSSLVARKFRTRHLSVPVNLPSEETLFKLAARFNEPVSDDAAVPLFQVNELLEKEFSGVITGTGGDELFGGHAWQPGLIAIFSRLEKEGLWSGASGGFPPAAVAAEYGRNMLHCSHFKKRTLYAPGFLSALGRGEDPVTAHLRSLIGRCAAKDITNMVLDCDMKSFLPEYLFMNAYAAFARKGLKVLAPFLYGDMVSLVSPLPGRWKIKGRLREQSGRGRKTGNFRGNGDWRAEGLVQKYLLREAFRDLLPPEITDRGKRGLTCPYSEWLRKDLKLFWYEKVIAKGFLAGAFLEKKALQVLFYEHQSGKADHGSEMWNLLMFELWKSQ
ncbi:MAG: asparagine synthase-related protein [Elusimicrobiales bacterium]|nr:asparagine synthase-related protein [Elusimicrobiales bacterium]